MRSSGGEFGCSYGSHTHTYTHMRTRTHTHTLTLTHTHTHTHTHTDSARLYMLGFQPPALLTYCIGTDFTETTTLSSHKPKHIRAHTPTDTHSISRSLSQRGSYLSQRPSPPKNKHSNKTHNHT